MQVSRVGPAAGDDLLFVLGWGNRPGHPTVAWFLDELVDAGYCVHAVELPTNGTDFEAHYRAPVRRYAARHLDEFHLLGHSTGGLVAAHLDVAGPRVYLSPWWGIQTSGWLDVLGPLLLRIPTSRPLIPVGGDTTAVGALKEDVALAESPDAVSPAFVRAIRDGQTSLPPFRDGSRVFCTLRDRVVSVRAIGDHAPADAISLYDGGHEFFASACRERVLPDVLAAVDSVGAVDPVDPATAER